MIVPPGIVLKLMKTLVWHWYYVIQCNMTDKIYSSLFVSGKSSEMGAGTENRQTSLGLTESKDLFLARDLIKHLFRPSR